MEGKGKKMEIGRKDKKGKTNKRCIIPTIKQK